MDIPRKIQGFLKKYKKEAGNGFFFEAKAAKGRLYDVKSLQKV